jgi:iron complex transport system substrate-binding protein
MTTQFRRNLAARALLVLALAAVAAMSVAFVACGTSSQPASSPSASSSAAGPVTVTDDAGEEVTLAEPAARVVSLAPANTEIAYAIGAGDRMVGGTSYDDYPEEAKALPKIGDFANPSVEKIVAMQPDLVLAAGGVQDGLRSKLEKLGMQVYVIDPVTFDGVVDDIRELGQLMGVQDQAEHVAQTMEAAAAAVAAKVGSLDKPVTFVEIYSKPLMTAGSGSFIDDLVTHAGGVNLGAAAGQGYPYYSSETLIDEDPAVYIAVSGAQSTPGEIAKRPGYAGLTAVKDGRVYVIDDNLIARPGPRLVEGLQQLAEMIHPEAYQAQ